MAASLTTRQIASELAGYQVILPAEALAQLSVYLELLLRWNRRINLTGLREPRLMVRRLFGESLYVARLVELRGRLVDVGSGAGFPGLALKLVAPDLQVTLIEQRRKKCVFLKEVVRQCGFANVDVVAARFQDYVEGGRGRVQADLVTTRAVEVDQVLLRWVADCLVPGGRGVFLTTRKLGAKIRERGQKWCWEEVRSVPKNDESVVLVGSAHR